MSLRVAVVGCGRMGALHAQKLKSLTAEDVELAGVADENLARAQEVGDELSVRAVADYRELFSAADAAVAAVPTVHHFSVVRDALKAGLDVMVEKPMASSLQEAEELLALARAGGRILQVGHLERFNAALRRVRDSIRQPRFIEAHRLGPFPSRATDVDVVLDLMIHDLDIIQHLVGSEPERVEAVGVPVLTQKVDIANARLSFPNGCVANVTASRVSPNPMRKIRIFQPDAYFSIDFLDQSVALFTREPAADGEGFGEIRMEKLEMDRGDALLAELRAFVAAVRERSAPAVSGEEALEALRSATRVIDSMPELATES